MNSITVLDVRLYGQSIGTLTRLPGDRVLFAFTEAYASDANRPTLSLSFKDSVGSLIEHVRPTQTRLPPFFANLLPEGALREYLAKRAGVKPEREFFLISVLGRDLPGALEIHPTDGAESVDVDESPPPETLADNQTDSVLHFSLAGIQLKFSAIKAATGGLTIPADGVGGSWIVKLPAATLPNVPENEFAMMELARRVGISVPETALVPVREISGLPQEIATVGNNAFVIRRFDRTDVGGRIHIEDFAQVFGVYPERKYERASYRDIAEVLWAETGEVGIVEFLRRLVFNVLIGNADMHLKNWSLIYPDRRTAALAPAYDLVSTISYLPKDRRALTFVDSKAFSSVSIEQFERFASKARLPTKLTVDTVNETLTQFAEVWRNSIDHLIPDHVREAVDRHLRSVPMWNASAAGRYQVSTAESVDEISEGRTRFLRDLIRDLTPVIIFGEELEHRLFDPWLQLVRAQFANAASTLRDAAAEQTAIEEKLDVLLLDAADAFDHFAKLRLHLGSGDALKAAAKEAVTKAKGLLDEISPTVACVAPKQLAGHLVVLRRQLAMLDRDANKAFESRSIKELQTRASELGRQILSTAQYGVNRLAPDLRAALLQSGHQLHLSETERLYIDGGASAARIVDNIKSAIRLFNGATEAAFGSE